MATQTTIPAIARYYHRVPISEEALDAYEQYADMRSIPLEEVLAERLEKCVDHIGEKPLFLNDQHRSRLEVLLGKNVQTPEQLVALVAKSLVIDVGKVKIALKPSLLDRLKTRCFEPDFSNWLAGVVRTALEQYVGLR